MSNETPKEGLYMGIILILSCFCVASFLWGLHQRRTLQELREAVGPLAARSPAKRRAKSSLLSGLWGRRMPPRARSGTKAPPRMPPPGFLSGFPKHGRLTLNVRPFGRRWRRRFRSRYARRTHTITLAQWESVARWPKSLLRRIQRVNFTRVHLAARHLLLLRHTRYITGLSLSSGRMDGAGLAVIAGLPALNYLSFNRMAGGLSGLCKGASPSLRSLSFYSMPTLGDADLHCVCKLSSLSHLTLNQLPKITDKGFSCMGSLVGLRTLRLTRVALRGPAFAHLKGLASLRTLSISQAPHLTDAGMAPLAGLMSLYWLSIDRTAITGRSLAPLLKATSSLRYLSLRNNPIDDTGIAALAASPTLNSLDLSSTRITHKSLKSLGSSSRIHRVSLNHTRVGDIGVFYLSRLKALRQLSLNYTDVTDAGLAHLPGMRSLMRLHLQGTSVSDKGLPGLSKLPLRFLDLSRTRVSARGLLKVRWPFTLRTLYVSSYISPRFRARLRRMSPRLRVYRR